MLVCGCGGWMHTEGIEERLSKRGRRDPVRPHGMSSRRWLVGIDAGGQG